jgi:hypothetical protein
MRNGLTARTSLTLGALLVAGFLVFRTADRPAAQTVQAPVPTGMLTYHNDGARTGQNLQETLLTPAIVNPDQFGLLKTDFIVDGTVAGQPLYVPNVTVNGVVYNIVIVVTEHASVYAFDADVEQHPQNWASPLWVQSLLGPGEMPVPDIDEQDAAGNVCHDISPEIGITSTPVVDPQTGTLYVVVKTQETDQSFAYTLYPIDVATGLTKSIIGQPTRIAAPQFDALSANQRAGLALVNGIVLIGFASYCDFSAYHGWLFGYDTTNNLRQVVPFNTTPRGLYAGIWNSGAPPAIDTDGSVFVTTANGPYNPLQFQWGDTLLKFTVGTGTRAAPGPLTPIFPVSPGRSSANSKANLPRNGPNAISSPASQTGAISRPATTFTMLDSFTPFNQGFLGANDLDLGSGGVLLVPDQPGSHPHVLVTGGKQGLLYVVDRDQLTTGNVHNVPCSQAALLSIAQANQRNMPASQTETCDPILQAFRIVPGLSQSAALPDTYQGPRMFSTPTYWNGYVYMGAAGDNLKMYALNGGMLVNQPVSMSANVFGWPGVTASVSANGSQNGIVWVIDSGDPTSTPAVLYALDATNLSHVLYKSDGTNADFNSGIAPPPGRDTMTIGVRNSLPTVYGGKVFVATRIHLYVFGLL